MVKLQRAPQLLKCTPPTGHVVTFYFHFLRVNKQKRIGYTVIMKQSDTFVLDKCKYSEPPVNLHKLRKSKSVRLCPALPYFMRTMQSGYCSCAVS